MSLILPKRYSAKRAKVMKWFRMMDEKLCSFVEEGALRQMAAQEFFIYKVKGDASLNHDDRERLIEEAKLFKFRCDRTPSKA